MVAALSFLFSTVDGRSSLEQNNFTFDGLSPDFLWVFVVIKERNSYSLYTSRSTKKKKRRKLKKKYVMILLNGGVPIAFAGMKHQLLIENWVLFGVLGQVLMEN